MTEHELNYPNIETYTFHESISGRTFCLYNDVKVGTFLIDLPDKTLLNIKIGGQFIELLVPDKHDIYYCVGDVNFTSSEDMGTIRIHSQAISTIAFNRQKLDLVERAAGIIDVDCTLTKTQLKSAASNRFVFGEEDPV